ncbi:hypothetical protein STANM309S_05169 [Streptomyces tanashiensis]
MIYEDEPKRRNILKLGGALALTPLMTRLTDGTAAAETSAAPAGVRWPTLSRKALTYTLPATDWQAQALPIGNGRLARCSSPIPTSSASSSTSRVCGAASTTTTTPSRVSRTAPSTPA